MQTPVEELQKLRHAAVLRKQGLQAQMQKMADQRDSLVAQVQAVRDERDEVNAYIAAIDAAITTLGG